MAKCSKCVRPATHHVAVWAWPAETAAKSRAVEVVLPGDMCADHAAQLEQAAFDQAWQMLIERFRELDCGVPDPKTFQYASRWGRHHSGRFGSIGAMGLRSA